MTATSAQVKKMMSLFSGNMKAHGTHGQPTRNGLKWEIKNTAKTLREPVTEDLWRQHLDGKRPLGVVPINDDAQCFWGSIDVDEYDVDLLAIMRAAEKYPLVPCRSKSGGLHLFLFASEPVPAGDMRSALRALAASMGKASAEIFPKQSNVLSSRGDVGNWMVMPYYGDTYGGKLKNQHGLKKTGSEMTLQEFISFADEKRLNAKQFDELVRSTHTGKVAAMGKKKHSGRVNGTQIGGPFGDGPPCLQHLSNSGFPEGGRNSALFMVGLYLKRAFPADWRKRLEEDNQKFMKPPLTSDEVTQVRKQLDKKEYEYTCKTEPMQSHCDAGICRTRKFGVGGGASDYPEITSMTQFLVNPPIWFVDVNGHRLEVLTEDLMNYSRFCLEMAKKTRVILSPMKQADWIKLLQEASRGAEPLSAPMEMTQLGHFRELLQEFLTNRARGTRMEDILMNKPVLIEEQGRYYFQFKDFETFLDKKKMSKAFPRNYFRSMMVQLDGGHVDRHVKKETNRSLWWVPQDKIEGTPTGDPGKIDTEEV